MNLLASLFGSNKQVAKVTSAVIKAGDAMFFTKEEKSQASMKRLEFVLKFHQATSGSNVARRLIAVMVVAVFLLLIVITAGLIAFDASSAGAMKVFIVDALGESVRVIIGFYFTAGIVNRVAEGVEKWKK